MHLSAVYRCWVSNICICTLPLPLYISVDVFPADFDPGQLDVQLSSKLVVLQHMLNEIVRSKKKIVVVSNYVETLDIIHKLCNNYNWTVVRLDGKHYILHIPGVRMNPLLLFACSTRSACSVFLLSPLCYCICLLLM